MAIPKTTPMPKTIKATGQVVDGGDLDQLIDLYEGWNRVFQKAKSAKLELALLISRHAPDTGQRTCRVEGKTRKAKITFAGDSWDQSVLKEIWNAYPKLRDRCLKISEIGVKKREEQKLRGTKSDQPDVEQFISMLRAANRGPTGMPRIDVEV